jgi:hypothetical protein
VFQAFIKIITTVFQVFMNHMQDVVLLLACNQNLDNDNSSGVYESYAGCSFTSGIQNLDYDRISGIYDHMQDKEKCT